MRIYHRRTVKFVILVFRGGVLGQKFIYPRTEHSSGQTSGPTDVQTAADEYACPTVETVTCIPMLHIFFALLFCETLQNCIWD